MTNARSRHFFSMTGFGRGVASSPQALVQIDLKSLNSRFLEIRARLPKILAPWEQSLRAGVGQVLRRGSVEVTVSCQFLEAELQPQIQTGVIAAYAKRIQELSATTGVESGLTVLDLLRLPGALSADEGLALADRDREDLYPLLEQALGTALTELREMRAKEGEVLVEAIAREADALAQGARAIRAILPLARQRAVERVGQRVRELLDAAGVNGIDPARLQQDLVQMADRSDMAEELDRLESHVEQVRALLRLPEGLPVGKRLDFLVQELLREVNTIGSKADGVEITNAVVDAKLRIERIREQVQNLE